MSDLDVLEFENRLKQYITKKGAIGTNTIEETLNECADKYNLEKEYQLYIGYYQLFSYDDSRPYLIIIGTKKTEGYDRITVRAETTEMAEYIAQKVMKKLSFQERDILSK